MSAETDLLLLIDPHLHDPPIGHRRHRRIRPNNHIGIVPLSVRIERGMRGAGIAAVLVSGPLGGGGERGVAGVSVARPKVMHYEVS